MSQGTDWIADQQEIYNDLLEDGVIFSFRRIGKGKVDPITGNRTEAFDESFSAPGIMRRSGSPSAQWAAIASALGATGLVQTGDETLLLAAGTYTPKLEDVTKINGETWVVKNISTLRPGTVPLLWYVQIRKA